MRVLVRSAFALGARVYHPGLYELDAALADDIAQLEREGWVKIVVLEDDDDPVRLTTPETGQSLTLRGGGCF